MSKFTKSIRRHTVIGALLLGSMSLTAQAETVTKLFESTTLVTGTSISLTELELSSPGTLIIKLEDFVWPALLSTLSFSLTDATQVLHTYGLDGGTSGTWSFDVAAAGTFYGAIFAKPSAEAKAGMFNLSVSYLTASPVPLPAAGWFLISGIAGLAALRPKQNGAKQKLSQSYA